MSAAPLPPIRFAILLIAALSLLGRPAEDRTTVSCADGSACVPAVQATGAHSCCTPKSCAHRATRGKTCVVRTERGTTLYHSATISPLKFDLPAPLAEVPLDRQVFSHLPHGRRGSTLGVDAERSPPLPDLLATRPTRAPPQTHASA